MNWSKEAEDAISKVPFFVRRKVKKRVEDEAQSHGASIVTMADVEKCRRRFMNNMEDEVKGYQIETCFGSGDCPNRAAPDEDLVASVEAIPELQEIRPFLKNRVKGSLKLHHEFRISISDCPNACSRPQITDIGIIGALQPKMLENQCDSCGACKAICREGAIEYSNTEVGGMIIDHSKCIDCGACLRACPAGALLEEARGYRIMVGGKLGRHPQLAKELDGIYSKAQVTEIVRQCIRFYLDNNTAGERFGETLNRTGIDFLEEYFTKKNAC